MSYSEICHLKPAAFRRYCELKPVTFHLLVEALKPRLPKTGQRGGSAYSRELAKARIKIEHVFAKLKVFRILSDRCRNRRKCFGLHFNLIACFALQP